ncbi:major facilitator superfamily domain-containing protein [Fomitopsis serialis]|uniref:major facilitator superfamily domain-containing protein n=1 Tax=Fomitopsis serialis TaxID=139415 RepID=UPI002007F9D6|nr:major facilitator superfamily domain-containing protein [Neoantrodia serialis]KAH9910603.1 major facilitator superfamily domain-containing protein [Neoantrodia serialis]
MSTRIPSANEPTRSSDDVEKKDAVALTESLSRDPYPHAYAEEDLFEEGAVDAVYQAKARVLNAAVREIGMGRYQWYLFVVAGFGWFSYVAVVGLLFWSLVAGLILNPVIAEFQVDSQWLSLALNIGLFAGAVFWALGCDIWGRRWPFNFTLFIAGVFGLAAGGAPNFVTLASLFAVVGFGVGGNMPVDSAVFLDFVPGSHQYLLTILSIWWAIGQLVASLIAWPLISNISCPETATTCTKSENMGWRYLLPRYLVGRGRDADAVAVIHRIAAYNGRSSSLTVEQLAAAGERAVEANKAAAGAAGLPTLLSGTSVWTTYHIRSLFKTAKLAWSTSLLIVIWGIIGLASTLYNSFLPTCTLAHRDANYGDSSYYTTYRQDALIAGWAVELPTGLTGVFLFASTTSHSSNALLGWNCGYAFASNIMYGVLYAISPEVFPAKDRGTGNGLTATATRVFGIIVMIAMYANLETAAPVYVSGA